MYTRVIGKRIKHIISERIPSSGASTDWDNTRLNSTSLCSIVGHVTKPLGTNFDCTIAATTGAIYVLPEGLVEPTSTNAFLIEEGAVLEFTVKTRVALKGYTTNSKYQAVVWSWD